MRVVVCLIAIAIGAAQEGAEDDPELAMRDLTALIERHNPKRVVVIGITCSMSVRNDACVVALGGPAFCLTEMIACRLRTYVPSLSTPWTRMLL